MKTFKIVVTCGTILVLLSLVACESPTRRANTSPTPSPATVSQAARTAPAGNYQPLLAGLGDRCYPGDQFPTAAASSSSETVAASSNGSPSNPSAPTVRPDKTDLLPYLLQVATSASPGATKKRAISSAEELGLLSDIELAKFKKDELIVIGPPARGAERFRPDDWYTVFRAISGVEAPGVTIDPGPNPRLMQVRYFGSIQQTALGNTFFEADRTLKLLSTGFDNLTCAVWPGRPQNIPSELDLMTAEIGDGSRPMGGERGWHRFWFEPSEEPIESDGSTVRIPKNRLIVKDESIPPGQSRGSARQFAASISANFLGMSERIRSFGDLQRDAALVILAKWMRDKQIPADEDWVGGAPGREETVTTTPSITVLRSKLLDQVYLRYGIHGGVDFQKDNRYSAASPLARGLSAAAEKSEVRGARSWQFNFDGRTYRAVRLRIANPVRLGLRWIVWQHVVTQGLVQPSVYRVVIPEGNFGNFVVTNSTGQVLTIQMVGPVNRTDYVQPGSTALRVVPGSYRLSATIPSCGTKNDSVTVAAGVRHELRYTCVQSTQALQPAAPVGGGSFIVNNNTGAAITVSVGGRSYTFAPGSSTIQLSPGNYTATVTAKCGMKTEQINIQNGSTFTGQYTCVTR